ncbi:MAG: maltose/maltodextrin ABC transporter substrate-binding protein MalE [Burkholderiaceae bacterium]|jgi:maltose/maltodextrin transport system substrate-binding protein|nr:maltose/maltodextrin ABC transporter substrate-binding protein MalE [Burkholderiaceae bacterium]
MSIKTLKPVAIAAAAVAALAFAGAASAQEAGKLLVWINGDKGYNGLQKVGDEFAKKAGVPVTVEHPEDAPGKFQQAAAAGKGPDIFCWPHDRMGEWAKSGLIVPINPSKRVRDEVEETAWKAFAYQGKTWGYPISVEAIGLIYNKALVKTPPKSFDDVLKIDKELSAQGKKAILWDYNNTYFTWPILAAGGGYVFGRDAKGELDPSKVGVNNPGAVTGAQLLADMIKNGQMPKGSGYAEMESAFTKGNVAMMISGPWAWDNLRKANIDFGVAPIPDVAGKPSKPFVGVLGCMIAAPSKSKDIAKEFIENHLMRPEGLKMVNADVPLGTPANKAFFTELSSNPNIKATMENARRGEPMPNIPEMGRFWSSMASALENITNGRQAPKEALDAAAARMLGK